MNPNNQGGIFQGAPSQNNPSLGQGPTGRGGFGRSRPVTARIRGQGPPPLHSGSHPGGAPPQAGQARPRRRRPHPLYEIRPAGGDKGLGLFATQDISRGICVLRETHLFRVPAASSPWVVLSPMEKILAFCDALVEQGIFFGELGELSELTARPETLSDEGVRKACRIFLTDFMIKKRLDPTRLANNMDFFVSLYAVFVNNRYRERWEGLWTDTYVFLTGSRINHDCSPNCIRWIDRDTKELTVYAIKNIKAGDEITVAYVDSPGLLQSGRAWRLVDRYGVRCACAMCRDWAVTDPLQRELSDKYWASMYLQYPALLEEEEEEDDDDEDPWVAASPQEALECCMRAIELLEHPAMDLPGMTPYRTYQMILEWYEKSGDLAKAVEYAGRAAALAITMQGSHGPLLEEADADFRELRLAQGDKMV